MSELKTQPTDDSVEAFLNGVENEKKRQDSFSVLNLLKEITGEEPQMWGSSIVGFGRYRYKYASGREGEWFLTGFSPRKQNLTLYISIISSFLLRNSIVSIVENCQVKGISAVVTRKVVFHFKETTFQRTITRKKGRKYVNPNDD